MRKPQNSLPESLEIDISLEKRLDSLAEKMQESIARNRRIAAPMFDEFVTLGFKFTSFSDLKRTDYDRSLVVPVILRWLTKFDDPHIKDMLAERLNIKSLRHLIVPELLKEFQKLPEDRYHFAKWRMGDIIGGMADDKWFDEISAILLDRSHGDSRQMLTLSLGKMKKRAPDAIRLLNRLLGDNDMPGHVMSALRTLNGQESRPNVERYLASNNTWLRNEAKKTIAKFDKLDT